MGGDFQSKAIILIAFLVPGICFLLVFRLLCDVQKLDKVDQTAVAFIISIGSHAAAELLAGASLFGDSAGTPVGRGGDGYSGALAPQSVSIGAVLVPVLVAVAASVLFSAVYQSDIIYPPLRRLRLTRKTGRLSVWHHSLVSHDGCWLIVEYDDGKQLLGWAREFSIQGESRELFLGDVTVLEPLRGGLWRRVEIPGPGVYIPDMSRIRSVRFLDGAPE